MKIINTADPSVKPPINMIVYGDGGVGKTSFVTTAPKPLLLDLEGGSKYFGLRGIKLDVATIESWSEIDEVIKYAAANGYETLAIDPIGELMALLRRYMESLKDSKLTMKDGSPTQAGWGYMKQNMRSFLRKVRDARMHTIVIAHVDPKDDEGRQIMYPMVETKIRQEMINMFDIVGYMTIIGAGESAKRAIIVDPESDKYKSKDRTGQLGKYIEPDFTKIVHACQGTEVYSWSAQKKEQPEAKKEQPTEPETEAARKMREAKEAAKANIDKVKDQAKVV
jgi:phage nucleotide-binding protein